MTFTHYSQIEIIISTVKCNYQRKPRPGWQDTLDIVDRQKKLAKPQFLPQGNCTYSIMLWYSGVEQIVSLIDIYTWYAVYCPTTTPSKAPHYSRCSFLSGCNLFSTQNDNSTIDDQTDSGDIFESWGALSRLLIEPATLVTQFAQWWHRCRKFTCAWSSCRVSPNDKQPKINFHEKVGQVSQVWTALDLYHNHRSFIHTNSLYHQDKMTICVIWR